MVGLAAFSSVHEPPDQTVRPRASFSAQLRRAAHYLRTDRNYRHFLLLRVALMIAGAATPFFAVFVQQKLGGPLGMVGVYLGVYTAASLLANAAFGRFASRLGNRRMMLVATVAGLVMTGLVLALMLLAAPLRLTGWAASLWLVPVFALSGLRESGLGVGAQSLLLDLAPPAERSLYLGFTNSLLGVVLLATGLGGVVVAQLGFPALLVVAVAGHAFALRSALRLREVSHAPASSPEPSRALNQAQPAP